MKDIEEKTVNVNVYWKLRYVERLDAAAARKGIRRNDYIKQAVAEKLEKDEQAIAK